MTEDKAFSQLKNNLKNQIYSSIYIFYGEEEYLRKYYVGEIKKSLVDPTFEAFNYHHFDGKSLTMESLSAAVEAFPMMAENTLIQVDDFDIFHTGMEDLSTLLQILQNIPEYCHVLFNYISIDFKLEKKKEYSTLNKFLSEKASVVKFIAQDKDSLTRWVKKHFMARGKTIEDNTVEYLLFQCGTLMSGLLLEIEKISAYSKDDVISIEDINATVDPILEARIFDITNAISSHNYERACVVLGQLMSNQEEPIAINALIGKELRKIYSAKLALENKKNIEWLMNLWDMKSNYPAKLLMETAHNVSHDWCIKSIHCSELTDYRLKGESSQRGEDELKSLIIQLAQEV